MPRWAINRNILGLPSLNNRAASADRVFTGFQSLGPWKGSASTLSHAGFTKSRVPFTLRVPSVVKSCQTARYVTLRSADKRQRRLPASSTASTPAPQKSPSPSSEPQTSAPVQPQAALPTPSAEQAEAIRVLRSTRDNIIVNACAGSGKTTTILQMAAAAPDQKFLVLVYNRRLMVETTERVAMLGLENITVMNYHTLGSRCYTTECCTDQGLKRVFQEDMQVKAEHPLPECDVLVMDEQQDMTPILKLFMDKVLRDMGFAAPDREKNVRIVVLGDPRQELYGFNNSDWRFLTMASDKAVFGYLNDEPWTTVDQPSSNRVTHQNVQFINEHMLNPSKDKHMIGVRTTDANGSSFPRPRYIICDVRKEAIFEVERLLEELEVPPEQIIILAPSVRGRAAVLDLTNELALKGYPVFVGNSDDSEVDPEVARGKILVCTFHQAKGIERDAVVVFSFDEAYHTFYNKVSEPLDAATNPHYVAATRGKTHLVLLHDYKSPPLPFVNMSTLEETCDVVYHRELVAPKIPTIPVQKTLDFAVTSLTRNIPESVITQCVALLELKMGAPPMYGANPATTIIGSYGLAENVSAITGTAAPAIYEWKSRRTSALVTSVLKNLKQRTGRQWQERAFDKLPSIYRDRLEMIGVRMAMKTMDTSDILYAANVHVANMEGLVTQMLAVPLDSYNWLSEDQAADIFYTLREHVPRVGVKYEKTIKQKFSNQDTTVDSPSVNVIGVPDILAPTGHRIVWEIKYTDTLQAEHVLQAALYALIMESSGPPDDPPVDCYLLSAKTGQVVHISPRSPESYAEILRILVEIKSVGNSKQLLNSYDDGEFLRECREGFTNLVGPVVLPEWFNMRPTTKKQYHLMGVAKRRRKAKKDALVE